MSFIYNVKFVCGIAKSEEFIVSPGLYTTEINILNFDRERTTEVLKLFIPVVINNKAIAREPKTGRALAKELIRLAPNSATMDDCLKITKMLKAGSGLKIGFLKIESTLELAVTAVYTVMDINSKSVSIDVEQIQGKEI